MAVELFHKTYLNSDSNQYLIILHGVFGSLDNWHTLAKQLAQGINVISVDLRNHGKSPHNSEMSYMAMAEDVNHLLETRDIASAIILGHSMGGKVAMSLADLHPDKIEKLIVVDIAPKAYKPGHTAYFKAFRELDFSSFKSRSEADAALLKYESNLGVRQFLLKNLERSEDGYKLKFNIRAIETFYPELIGSIEFQWLINSPTIFIYGGNSNYVTETDFHKIEEVFTDVEFEMIDGAGHWVHAEKPQEILEVIEQFIG